MASELRVPEEGLVAGATALSADASRYVVKVHRKKVGDSLLLFDPVLGMQAEARIVSDRLPLVGIELGALSPAPSDEMPLTLIQAVGKADKPEQAIRDVTAHGAEALVLVQSERSVARSEGASRGERLSRVSAQVARQCGRGRLPQLRGPLSLQDALSSIAEGAKCFVCAWHEEALPLLEAFEQVNWNDSEVVVLIGPEGGLSEAEVSAALARGFTPVSLGPYVLRAEVACAAVLSVARAHHSSR